MADHEQGAHANYDPTDPEIYIVHDDDEALAIISHFRENLMAGSSDEIDNATRADALQLLDIAMRVSDQHSFTHNQTYPRPSHPFEGLRKSAYFTFASVLISLRCTLETERAVTGNLMTTAPNDADLLDLSVDRVASIVKPSGFAERKAPWIVNGLRRLATDPTMSLDVLTHEPLADARTKVLALQGFGPKATDCFLLAGLNRPVFPVDINIFTLVCQTFPGVIEDATPNFSSQRQVRSVKQFLERTLPNDVRLFQVLHTYLLLATKHNVGEYAMDSLFPDDGNS